MSEARITKLGDLKEGEGYTIGSSSGVVDIVVTGIREDGIINCRLSVVQSPDTHELFDNAQNKAAQLMGWVSDVEDCLPELCATRSLPFSDQHLLMIYMRNVVDEGGPSDDGKTYVRGGGYEHQTEFLGPDCTIVPHAELPPPPEPCVNC